MKAKIVNETFNILKGPPIEEVREKIKYKWGIEGQSFDNFMTAYDKLDPFTIGMDDDESIVYNGEHLIIFWNGNDTPYYIIINLDTAETIKIPGWYYEFDGRNIIITNGNTQEEITISIDTGEVVS